MSAPAGRGGRCGGGPSRAPALPLTEPSCIPMFEPGELGVKAMYERESTRVRQRLSTSQYVDSQYVDPDD